MNEKLNLIFDECSQIEHQLNLANFILSQIDSNRELRAIKHCVTESRERLLTLLHTKLPNVLDEKP